MSDIKEIIRENNRNARKSRLINNILWGIVTILIGFSFYATFTTLTAKSEAVKEKEAKEIALIQKEKSLKLADSLVDELRISQENLEGEKAKLELIKVKFDSIRQITLNQNDDLWEYAKSQNTIEAYTDYAKIKGVNKAVSNKIKSLLRNTGFIQIQDTNGDMLISPISSENGLWKAKTARSIRNGVIGNKYFKSQSRNGDVILEGQPFVILKDSIMSGDSRWAKIAY